MKKLLIVGNSASVHTNNFKSLVEGYFSEVEVLDSRSFSLKRALQLIKSVINARRVLKNYSPSLIALYQIDVAAFFITLIKGKTKTLVIGIGSDVLIVSEKSVFNKFLARYVINRGSYFNAGSIAIAEKMQKLSKREIEITLANLGVEDILPKEKQNIIFSNRLHKDLYNIDKVISAFARFVEKQERKDWKLVIAATGKEEEFACQCRELGIEKNVEFVHWLDKRQNAYYYSISKIWVSLPTSDSISLSLLEAMSAKCIPVCYDVVALRGFLIDNENGVVVKDFEENFFERALLLDNEDILQSNRTKARRFADKDLNRRRFYSIFDKEF